LSAIIRSATEADINAVHKIEMGSYPDPWPRSIFFLMRGRAPDLFIVTKVEGSIVGYAIGDIEWRRGIKIGHVMNIAIAKEWRRKGFAEKLLNELEVRLRERGAKIAYLEVRASNTSAQRLYKKIGYREAGVLPHYYRDEDGLAMEKPFT
jgi:ribosomal-protein-alanine N-acetyltransferase